MAKKSNKTEHVLKLITKNEDTVQDDVFFAIDQEIDENDTSAVKKRIVEPEADEPEPEADEPEPEADEPALEADEPALELETDNSVSFAAPEETKNETPTLRAFREQERAGTVILEPTEDLVNIAEVLAREKIALVMERMKVCTCKTCINDVLALALNSLPTKYVTTDTGKQYFQRDEYKKQYETDILAALTKACVRVKASPRH